MTDVFWVFRRHWHPRRFRFARLRALYWIVVRRHETEICGRCGGPVSAVWHAPDDLWWEASGYPGDAGVLCMRCFTHQANALGLHPYWEAARGGVWPSCSGSPCAHEETMMIVARQRDRYWDALVARCGSFEEAVRLVGQEPTA